MYTVQPKGQVCVSVPYQLGQCLNLQKRYRYSSSSSSSSSFYSSSSACKGPRIVRSGFSPVELLLPPSSRSDRISTSLRVAIEQLFWNSIFSHYLNVRKPVWPVVFNDEFYSCTFKFFNFLISLFI
ncbi:hypothetical protein R5R35_009118 [Gryllus longicercus]|uniref:Uncharacterized protein n=1 Tax=Gryllus longicercus TaxID=2509291 RepID=A0AAN9VSL3_9ORTH